MSDAELVDPDEPDDLPPFPPCQQCGMIHARRSVAGEWHPTCRGHKVTYSERDPNSPTNIRTYTPCFKFTVTGMKVCSTHGGKSPNAIKGLKRRQDDAVIVERIRLEVEEVDPVFLEQHPIQGLLEECGRSAQIVAWLARMVAKLHVDDPDEGQMASLTGFDEQGNEVHVENHFRLLGLNHDNDLTSHPLWDKLDKERERHAKLCKLALDAGINERLVNIAQQQAIQMSRVLAHVLDHIGLSPDKLNEARSLMARELRAIGPGGTGIMDQAKELDQELAERRRRAE